MAGRKGPAKPKADTKYTGSTRDARARRGSTGSTRIARVSCATPNPTKETYPTRDARVGVAGWSEGFRAIRARGYPIYLGGAASLWPNSRSTAC